MSLVDDLTAASQPPYPKGFKPGIVYSGRAPQQIVTPWMKDDLNDAAPGDWEDAVAKLGVALPPGKTLELVEAKFHSAGWHRDAAFVNTKDSAYTAPMWAYRFKVVTKDLRADEDLAALAAEARKKPRRRVLTGPLGGTKVINLADFQIGKTDHRGGTAETLEASEEALAEVEAMIRADKPAEIVLADVADSTEGFESSPNAARTNDLQQTEQIRVWRRTFWRWIDSMSAFGVPLKVVSVPSNHCRVRKGKDAQGPPDDDWGIEVLTQVSDIAEANPAKYGHVSFHAPAKYEEHVTLTLVDGKVISFAHGHQERNVNRLPDWVKRHGRRPLGMSDLVVVGHFHHLRLQAFGDGQFLFVCPTFDPGSSWFTPLSGEESDRGILTFSVDDKGWRDLRVVWA